MSEFENFAEKEMEAVKAQLSEEPSFLMKILRGHLLIEQKLNEILDISLLNPEVLHERGAPRINFHLKTYIVRSVAPANRDNQWIWPTIAKLNAIRNKMAHGLESKSLEKATEEFVSYLKDNDAVFADSLSQFGKASKEEECEGAIASIYAYLTVYAQKLKESRKHS